MPKFTVKTQSVCISTYTVIADSRESVPEAYYDGDFIIREDDTAYDNEIIVEIEEFEHA